MRRNQNGFSLTRLVFGLAVIAVGLVLSLDRLDFVDGSQFYRYWPVLVIAVGATKLFSRRVPDLVFAALLIGIGAWLLLNSLGYIDVKPWFLFWPVVLLLMGGFLVAGALRTRGAPVDSDDYIRAFALLGGSDRKSNSLDFRGADLTAVMGGCEVDLRRAKIGGGTPEINVFAFWGGVEVRVPQDWRVDVGVWPIFGAFEDQTEQEVSAGAPVLKLKGAAIMGGVGIRN